MNVTVHITATKKGQPFNAWQAQVRAADPHMETPYQGPNQDFHITVNSAVVCQVALKGENLSVLWQGTLTAPVENFVFDLE